jgi:hypothetical protein
LCFDCGCTFTFRALSKTYGQMWLRCDGCRRYARLKLAGLHDVDYRTKAFSCSVCGSEAYFCLIGPTKELGMHDYRLDEHEHPERHPAATKWLTEPLRRPISSWGRRTARSQDRWTALGRAFSSGNSSRRRLLKCRDLGARDLVRPQGLLQVRRQAR